MPVRKKKKIIDYHDGPPKSIRGIDPVQWDRVKKEALSQQAHIYQIVNQALREYVDYRDYLERVKS